VRKWDVRESLIGKERARDLFLCPRSDIFALAIHLAVDDDDRTVYVQFQ